MSTPNIKILNTLIAKRSTPISEQLPPHFDLRLRLSHVLHTTLDIKELLELFSTEITPVLSIDSITYINSVLSLFVSTGKSTTHSCSYRLVNDNVFLGELIFTRSKRFNEQELMLIESLLGIVVFPIRNALKYREAVDASMKDPLTGAGNRVAMDTTIEREIDLAKRHSMPLSILMIDLDYFKKINDKHGHPAGDYILKCLVTNLKNSTRKVDITFRYGGEEFVILLNSTPIDGALILAERLRKLVENMQCQYNEHNITTTVSIGAATLNDKDNMQTLIERADNALYKAKKEKRNRVCTLELLPEFD